jgi:Fe-Mn family superoxide dismutase
MKDLKNSRRNFIRTTALGAGALMISSPLLKGSDILSGGETFELPPLPYAAKALEPYIDRTTMEIHHGKHHAGYVRKLNAAVEANGLSGKRLEELFMSISELPDAVRNNAGGHYNHSLFWELMTPAGGGEPQGMVADAINGAFGNFNRFRDTFNNAATSRFGSGWAWLVVNRDGKLEVGSTPNQDNPLMNDSDFKGYPVMGIDVWEHAYYLKYQNKRGEYVKNWWRTINWKKVAERLEIASR